jgi:hypothetical protein
VQKVREDFYRPLERSVMKSDAPELLGRVQDPDVRERLPAHLKARVGQADELDFKDGQEVVEALEDILSGPHGPGTHARISGAKREIMQEMEEVFPGYREANRQYARAIERLDSHEAGVKAWRMTGEEIDTALKGMATDEAREGFRLGALDAAERALYELEGGGSLASRMSRAGPGMKERVVALFDGDTEAAQRYLAAMERSGRLRVLSAAVFGGPNTAQRLTDVASQQEAVGRSGVVREIISMFWSDPKAQAEAADIVADVLTTQGEDAARKAAAVMARGGRGARSAVTAGSVVAGQQAQGLLDER